MLHHQPLLRREAGLQHAPLAMTRAQHVEIEAQVGVEEPSGIERGFTRGLDADEENQFHARTPTDTLRER
ncbi:hypothetical protein [Stutzerimonas nosocomialis]|uniref:hypothetical protein n=1 Tax=Stutzerimonas nosocomialis TaxID=1056496 RepID=UPI001F4F41E5|nr:hypothetical protein [Stutzerimonas nosocomialis]